MSRRGEQAPGMGADGPSVRWRWALWTGRARAAITVARAAPRLVPWRTRIGEAGAAAVREGSVPVGADDRRDGAAEALGLFFGRAPRRLALEVQDTLALLPPDVDD